MSRYSSTSLISVVICGSTNLSRIDKNLTEPFQVLGNCVDARVLLAVYLYTLHSIDNNKNNKKKNNMCFHCSNSYEYLRSIGGSRDILTDSGLAKM